MKSPLGRAAEHISLGRRSLVWSTGIAWLFSIAIVFTGGVVRVTGSGLGCPTWPACDATSLTSTRALGINGLIEFSNRAFTGLIVIAVGWVIVSARLQKWQDRTMTRLAWSQFWLVVANAIAGGVTVLTGLSPWVVVVHFLMAMALLTTTTLALHRARQRPGSSLQVLPPGTQSLTVALLIVTAAAIVAGTFVTGSGPHSGAASALSRMGFDWTLVTVIHGSLAGAMLILDGALCTVLIRARTAPIARDWVIAVTVVTVLQGGIGLIQALNGLPDVMVALHLLGAAAIWALTLRTVLSVQPGLLGPSVVAAATNAAADDRQGSRHRPSE